MAAEKRETPKKLTSAKGRQNGDYAAPITRKPAGGPVPTGYVPPPPKPSGG